MASNVCLWNSHPQSKGANLARTLAREEDSLACSVVPAVAVVRLSEYVGCENRQLTQVGTGTFPAAAAGRACCGQDAHGLVAKVAADW